MGRDIAGTDAPFGFAVLSYAPERTGFDIVLGIGDEDILGDRVDDDAIRYLDLDGRIVEPLVSHDLARLGVDDMVGGVGGIIVSGAGIKRITAQVHVVDRNGKGVNDLKLLCINAIEFGLDGLVVAARRDP